MDKRLFDRNPLFGITRYSYYDPDKDLLHIETVQDVEPVIEQNKASFNNTDERARHGDGVTQYATIPLHILEDLYNKGIWRPGMNLYKEEGRRFRAWLNDPENRYFRTRPGRV